MRDPRDYKVEISSGARPPSPQPSPGAGSGKTDTRPYVSVLFRCCNVYQRIYRSADGAKYEGGCPKCARPVRFLVGAGGTSERFFVVE